MDKKGVDYKKVVLNGPRGKFSICTQLFTEDELMQLKPVILLKELLRKVDIVPGEMDYKDKAVYMSFYVWLTRWRKARHKSDHERVAADPPAANKITVGEFQFTNPSAIKKPKSNTIKFVN